MVLANALLFLCLVGAWAYTSQHRRVLDDDTLAACGQAIAERQGGFGFDYRLSHPRFGGPNVLEASFDWEADRRDLEPPDALASGTVRCRVVAPGDTIDDPLTVTAVEVTR
jgi:hypothetical protein